MQEQRVTRSRAVVVACVVGLVLSVLGATGVPALTGGVRSAGTGVSEPATGAAPVRPPAAAPTTSSATASPVSSTAPPTVVAPRPTPSVVVPPPPPRTTPAAVPTRAPAAAVVLHPVVGVTDGDTLKVRVGATTERVRVIGIDTPELKGGECWAQKAASRMQSLVQSRSVQLVRDPTQDDRDRYGRLLRHVVTEDGRLVGQVLVEGGFAREYTYDRAYAHRDAYRAAQRRAQAARLGVWSRACAAPPAAAPAPAAPPGPAAAPAPGPAGTCVIKGNISSSGEKIYHVPGGGSYDVTVISQSKGERWFCTEQQARDAGWRKARN